MNKVKGTNKVLFVVTSCNVKGATGIRTGFNLSEVTHPLEKLEASGVTVDIASIKGGEAPLDGLEDLTIQLMPSIGQILTSERPLPIH